MLPSGRYLVLPLSIRPRSAGAAPPPAQPYVLRLGSAKPLLCEGRRLPPSAARRGLAAYARGRGSCTTQFEGSVRLYTVSDGAGSLFYVENTSHLSRLEVSLDLSESFNLLPSRGCLNTIDVIPPGHEQLLQALSLGGAEDGWRMRLASRYSASPLLAEVHSPELAAAEELHAVRPRAEGSSWGRGAEALFQFLR
jgi:hypothetical protein